MTPQIKAAREGRAPQNNSVLTTFPFLDNIHYCPFFQADIGLRLLFVVVQYNEVFENNGRTDVGTICKINIVSNKYMATMEINVWRDSKVLIYNFYTP